MAAAAEPRARAWLGGGSPRSGSPARSPELGGRGRARAGAGPGPGAGGSLPPSGHSFRKATLTKPTFCHLCSDFIWGLAGFLCDVCNFMSHEKCLKHVKTPCASVAPSLVRVPVAHCFGPRGLYKRKFCAVCRKGLEAPALRCEATVASAITTGTGTMTLSTTTGGRGTCPPERAARSAGRRAGPRTCWPACAASGAACRWGPWGAGSWGRARPPPPDCVLLCRGPGLRVAPARSARPGEGPWALRGPCTVEGRPCRPQAHSVCSAALAPECTFGRLHTLVLPPACVRLLSRNFSKMHCFRISESAVPEPGDEDDGVDGSTPAGLGREAPESSKLTLKIFDGNDALQRNHFRIISIPRLARSEEVLEAALRAYYVLEDPRDFELQPVPAPVPAGDSGARGRPRGSGAAEEEGGRGPEAWIVRAMPHAQELLRIYPAWLKVGVAYVSIRVTPQSTARTVVLEVLPLLGRQAEGPEGFQLVEVLMGSRQVQRTVLQDAEPLLARLRDIRQTSLRQMSQTRFYVAENRVVAPHVSLFVGGLPPGLSAQEYASLLDEAVATKAGLVSVSRVYSSQGAVVLDVACFAEAERLYMLVRDTAVHGRPLMALVLPDVLHSKLPPDCCPLLVFVNPKSGGLKGRDLLCSFRKLLNPHQVFELTNGGPLPGFHVFSQVPRFRVLVCGGDGTVGWVLAALEEVRPRLACPEPSVAILPLGTGNDLGRVLRWGAGYSGEDPLSVLVSVDEADAVLMDRWTILLDAHEAGGGETSVADVEPPKIVQMSNYCGIGIDAELSLDFHQAREEEPGKFTSRFHNKGVYVRVGLQKISHARGLHKEIRLQVEQQEVELPSIEGLIFINIPSWGSGADLWGSDSDSRFEKPRMDDGLLEVVGVTGVMHMGQVQGGLRSGIRIAQGSYFRVTLLKATPVQVDGEPWVQAPGHMIISAAGPKVHMLRKTKQKPRKAGAPKDARTDGVPAPEGDPK
ncbi:diacylglycerol kinase theta isoform X2 [Vulpes lagopus]|uniref:diacylglycerol kinase theta isoform X2 n=1 Tax=Vulpes lagopus TaxID=494514 RepID=UPI001BC9C222|nr:diacylglycerol kinase theta isoform X2 [Vulpes lagopus]